MLNLNKVEKYIILLFLYIFYVEFEQSFQVANAFYATPMNVYVQKKKVNVQKIEYLHWRQI